MTDVNSIQAGEGFVLNRGNNIAFLKAAEMEHDERWCQYLELSGRRIMCRKLHIPVQHADSMVRIQSAKADQALKIFGRMYASLHDLFINAEYYKSDARAKLGDCFMLHERMWEGELMFLKLYEIERTYCFLDICGITPMPDTVEMHWRNYRMKRDELTRLKRVDPSVLNKFEKIFNMSSQSLITIFNSALA